MQKTPVKKWKQGIYLPQPARQALSHRLNRIEGQIGALKKMIEKGECADDILIQIAAVKGAVTQVAVKILENHLVDCAKTCMNINNKRGIYERITRALATVLKQS
jgi:DNA-binding FrmR family transcriptional regulator